MSEVNGTVEFRVDNAIGLLTLNRPEKLNALSVDMLGALEGRLAEIDRRQDVRVVVLAAAGERAFSVGADVNAWSALEPLDMWRWWVRDGHRVMQRLASLRQPVIAAVQGLAFGGGLELAMAADVRIASADAAFAMPEVRIGTLPGWGGTQRLPALIGVARAKQMIFSGQRIDAATAERWGLVNEIVPASELADRVTQLAQQIAANAPVAVQLAKSAIDHDVSAPEAFAGALAAGAEDGREGMAAFREKRAPQFRGV
ncbi:MAG: enoyl-CoA hydratase/isomerase family protein [Thermomicrobiales bacterium]|nr:enoyl-CoA hydratase/isomerase family protein [Thermomicrobiales bacterium]